MNIPRLRRYVGPLSLAEIERGMHVITQNARDLLDDAEILFREQRYPRAVALAILSVEEIGKLHVLRRLITTAEPQVKQVWRDFRTHSEKNRLGLFTAYAKPSPKLRDFRPLFASASMDGDDIETLKQLAFYVDTYERGYWSAPGDVIGESLTGLLLRNARTVVGSGGTAVTTLPELELWKKHFADPATFSSIDAAEAALLAYAEEAHSRGFPNAQRVLEQVRRFTGSREGA